MHACRASRINTLSRTRKTGTAHDVNDIRLLSETERNTDATQDIVCKNNLTENPPREGDVRKQDASNRYIHTLNISASQKIKGALERECGIASGQSTNNACSVDVSMANATNQNASVPNGVIMGAETVNLNEFKDECNEISWLCIPAAFQSG